jgi:hypothetical protein
VAIFAVLVLVAAVLGFYALQLKRKVARDELAAQQLDIAPPANGSATPVVLYVASDADGSLRKMQINVVLPAERTERARSILRALLAQYLKEGSPHHIGEHADIVDVYLLDDGSAVVDANSTFADAHPSGVLAEELTVASLVVTLNANDNKIQRVKILVNGQERDTLAGHADLRRFYEAGNIREAVKDLQ